MVEGSRSQHGFTLIEIVLVLAIAGLLLIIVFLAVSGAQVARRDYQRKQDVARFISDSVSWSANNGGRVARSQAELDDLQAHYFHGATDPLSGSPYSLVFRLNTLPHSAVPAVGEVFYQQGHWCNRGPYADLSNPSNPIAGDDVDFAHFAVWTGLERGSWYCQDNGKD